MFLCRDRVGNGEEALCRDRVWPNGEVLCCNRGFLCCDKAGHDINIFRTRQGWACEGWRA